MLRNNDHRINGVTQKIQKTLNNTGNTTTDNQLMHNSFRNTKNT